jgi:hypothetical protein
VGAFIKSDLVLAGHETVIKNLALFVKTKVARFVI